MISCPKYGFFLLFILSSEAIPAQNLSETDPVLYNGKIYTYHLHPETKGNQFLQDQVFSKGWLKIRGNTYETLYINYDVFHQEVILKYMTHEGVSRQIIISDAWLEAFSYDDMYFELAGPDRKIFQT